MITVSCVFLQLNLKFEVEVLCKHLTLDLTVRSNCNIPYSLNILREKFFADLKFFDLPRKF